MVKEIQLRITLKEEERDNILVLKSAIKLDIDKEDITGVKILRKSIDARKPKIILNYKVAVYIREALPKNSEYTFDYKDVSKAKPIHIIGFGPAGMYAALRCIELGFKPIVLERGKNVKDRRRDLKAINQDHFVNEDSNYCFGEGGAGTYSDGKLYTRSLKRTNFVIKNNTIQALQLQDNKELTVDKVILATGHSARDIFYLLHEKQIALEAKSFAMGVRVEHPQHIIDSIQYHCSGERHELLPAASYGLVQQVSGRGVYSFCMCPGGFIVPAATANGEVVVNGMSPSKRNNLYANSGIVVEIDVNNDLPKYEPFGALKGLEYQKNLEKLAFTSGGRSQVAPAQRLTDFVEGKLSTDLNTTSYQPGLKSAPLHSLLPKLIGSRLRKGFQAFGQKMKGYYTEEANIVGVESRTSSPISIPRTDTLEHPQISNLYPCGEGGGYAGGIVSAAMDGERCAESAVKNA